MEQITNFLVPVVVFFFFLILVARKRTSKSTTGGRRSPASSQDFRPDFCFSCCFRMRSGRQLANDRFVFFAACTHNDEYRASGRTEVASSLWDHMDISGPSPLAEFTTLYCGSFIPDGSYFARVVSPAQPDERNTHFAMAASLLFQADQLAPLFPNLS